MPLITFYPSGKQIEARKGDHLIHILKEVSIDLDYQCGGEGTCGKCVVKIESGKVTSDGYGKLSGEEIKSGYICACRTKIADQDTVIRIPEQVGYANTGVSESLIGDDLIQQDLLPAHQEYNPFAVKQLIQVPEPKPQDGLSDIDRLVRQIKGESGSNNVVFHLSIIRSAADIIRKNNGQVTVTLLREAENIHIIDLESGDTTSRLFGISVDVGTTTVAVHLSDLAQGRTIAVTSDYNAQIRCGLDIISRINYAQRSERLQELRKLVLGTINKMIKKIRLENGIEKNEISNAVLSGNTTMTHLLLGLKPEYIRLEPYTPTLLCVPYISADEADIDINPNAWLYFSPAIGSYVGGDITAGLLCTDIAKNREEINLYIDIGTNGEIVIGNKDFLVSCACSAGPAFEGGGIENGMRAENGAISKVEIDSNNGIATCTTIGNVKPIGICGTGIISLLANLLLTGWIDPDGKLNKERENSSIVRKGKQVSYIIVPAAKSGTSKPIQVTETEIENIIRAKAAIYSACCLVLDQLEITFNDISTIYIAGGFGRHLDLNYAKTIGLIPDLPLEKFYYIGNASLIGSSMILASQDYREKQIQLANRITYIDLSTDSQYMDQYTAALFLPHTDKSQFPTVKLSAEN